MKRSRIGPKNYEAALAARIAQNERRREKASQKPRKPGISPRKPIARKQGLSQRRSKPLKAGKKTKAWESERRKLKKRFEAVGITTCEFDFIQHDCKVDDYLSFAHSTKRNDPEFNISEVAIACIPAHTILDEKMSHAEMKTAVLRAINQRKTQP